MKIGQVSFVQLSEPAERPYGAEGIGSKYQGQQGPTPSRYWQNFSATTERYAPADKRQAYPVADIARPRLSQPREETRHARELSLVKACGEERVDLRDVTRRRLAQLLQARRP